MEDGLYRTNFIIRITNDLARVVSKNVTY